jgi:hypothetical protein
MCKESMGLCARRKHGDVITSSREVEHLGFRQALCEVELVASPWDEIARDRHPG